MNFNKLYRQVLKIPRLNLNFTSSFCIVSESDFNKSLYSNSEDDPTNLKNLQDYLFHSILKDIVLETKDFFLINKPAGVSLFRSKPLQNLPYNGVSSKVTVSDVLPRLCSELKLKADSLIISSELPWTYSGLFVLSKSEKHANISKTFYKNSSLGKMPGYVNQLYRCLCWNIPKSMNSPVSPFSYTFLQPDPNDMRYVISYKCQSTISSSNHGQRKYWRKHIGHEVVSTSDQKVPNVALVDVKCNSTYRDLLPLYLLHQGCIVVGETVQASRLVPGGSAGGDACILPPEKANGARPAPIELRQRLGSLGRDMRRLPVHIDCQQLLVPGSPPLRAALSAGRSQSDSRANIDWDARLKLYVCSSHAVPAHFRATMGQLGIRVPFDDEMLSG